MLAIQQRDDADVVIPMIVTDVELVLDVTAAASWAHARDLDPVADRLAYRTHTFALVSRGRFGTLRLTPGLATGEDVEYSTAVLFSTALISATSAVLGVPAPCGGRRPGHRDAARGSRRSGVRSPPARLRDVPDPAGCRAQRAIATKLIRNHVISTLYNRLSSDQWAIDDRRELAEVIAKVMAPAPGASRPLSVVERRRIDVQRPDVADHRRHRGGLTPATASRALPDARPVRPAGRGRRADSNDRFGEVLDPCRQRAAGISTA